MMMYCVCDNNGGVQIFSIVLMSVSCFVYQTSGDNGNTGRGTKSILYWRS